MISVRSYATYARTSTDDGLRCHVGSYATLHCSMDWTGVDWTWRGLAAVRLRLRLQLPVSGARSRQDRARPDHVELQSSEGGEEGGDVEIS